MLTLVVTVIIIGGVLHSINNIRRTHIEPKKWVQVAKNSVDTTRKEVVLLKPDIIVRNKKSEVDKGDMTALYYGEGTAVTTWFGHKIDTTKEARAKIVIDFESATEPSTKTLFDVK